VNIPKGDPVGWLSKRIKPGQTVIDVGANVGHFSEAMVKAGAKVHAIEPDPRCWKELEERAPTWVHKVAAGDACAGALLIQGVDHSQSSLREESVPRPLGTAVETSVYTLDQLVPRPVDAIKIDIQGSELDVLRGAREHLRTCQLWIVEVWPHGLPDAGAAEIWNVFDDVNLAPYTLEAVPQPVSLENYMAWVESAQQNSFVNLAWM
jgi:FkbM family methyltransferase